jgi:hypothetical protein
VSHGIRQGVGPQAASGGEGPCNRFAFRDPA